MAEIWDPHVPGREHSSSRRKFSPRQKKFTWKYNGQIRHNKLHHRTISFSQTNLRNLNLNQITTEFPILKRITTQRAKLKSQINSQMSLQAKAQKATRNQRQISPALQSAQIINNSHIT
jgi:hypothetical protein